MPTSAHAVEAIADGIGGTPVLPEDAGEGKKAKRPRRTPRTYHPKYVEAARELCARFLDEVNDQGLLPEGWTRGKYDVSRPRLLKGDFTAQPKVSRLLDAA